MQGEVVSARGLDDGLDLLQRPNTTAAPVVGVFQTDEAGLGKVIVARRNGGFDLFGGELAALTVEQFGVYSGQRGRGAGFVKVNV